VSEAFEEHAPFFDLMDNKTRRRIMYLLHGSEHIPGHHSDPALDGVGCLSTAQLEKYLADGSDSNYHLNKLLEGGLVKRNAEIENNKAVIMWSITPKWLRFVKDFHLDDKISQVVSDILAHAN